MYVCYPTSTHQSHWTAVTSVDFHLAEAIQQQVEVRVCAKTKKKVLLLNFRLKPRKLPLVLFYEEGFDTFSGHHGPPTGCKSNLEFC